MIPHLKRSIRRAVLCIAAFVAALTQPCWSATINVPADQKTIQAGIDAASAGDTVLVAPGTYYENIDFKGKAVIVQSAGFSVGTFNGPGGVQLGGQADTIIDGGGKGPAVTFANGETPTSRLNGFTIQHGGGSKGIDIHNGDNQVTAGILVVNSAPFIMSNTITLNNCYGVMIENASPQMQDNIISSTDGTASGQCDFVAIGTGVLVDGALDNQPGAFPYFPTIASSLIENNTDETEDASSSGGGGIHVLSGFTYIAANVIRNNFSQQPGGGIAVSNYNPVSDQVYIVDNLIYGNSSACGGGGLAFNLNTAFGIGAPVYFIYNNTIADNTDTNNCTDSLHPNGSQVYLWQDSNRFVFANNIIAGTSGTFAAFYCETLRQYYPQYHLALFDHNDLYNPQGPVMAGQCLDPSGDSYGNISADPLFKDRSSSDYHLTAGSPAVDTGNNAAVAGPSFDLDVVQRQQDATGVGYPIVDMGAYEYPGTTNSEASPTLATITPTNYVVNVGDIAMFSIGFSSPSGTPLGQVIVYQDGQLFVGTNLDNNGNANLGATELVPGVHAIVAKYAGANGLTPAETIKLYIVVNGGIATNISLTSSLNPAPVGQSVTFTATLTASGGTPIGTVTFSDGTTTLGTQTLVNGVATLTTTSLAIGTHNIIAAYSPTGTTFNASNASLSQVVDGIDTTTTIASSLNPANVGQSVTFSANVTYLLNGVATPAPGSVIFYDGTTDVGGGVLLNKGAATFMTTSLTVGSHQIIAKYYPPDGTFTQTSAAVTQVINGIGTNISLSVIPTSAAINTAIQMNSTVTSGAPITGGSITFMDGATALSTIVVTAAAPTASFNISTFAAGAHSITSVYSGDTTHSASTSIAVVVTITAATSTTLGLSVTPDPGFALQPITLAAKLTGGTTGSMAGNAISFLSNGAVIGSATTDAQGNTSLLTTLATGNYSIAAAFAGTANLAATTSTPVAELISPNPTSTAVYAQPNPGYQGRDETLTVTVATLFSSSATPLVPTGAVVFFDAGLPIATASLDAQGHASFSTANLAVGRHSIIATYLGTQNFVNSTSMPYTLNILVSDFTLTTDPSITIQTEHHKNLNVSIASMGQFADDVALSCGNLPLYASCTFANQAPGLSPDTTLPFTIDIDTDVAHNFLSRLGNPGNSSGRARGLQAIGLGLLLPFTLLLARRRRTLNLLIAFVVFAGISALIGCSGHYPDHTPPGTYTFTITGEGVATHVTHTATVTLVVTE